MNWVCSDLLETQWKYKNWKLCLKHVRFCTILFVSDSPCSENTRCLIIWHSLRGQCPETVLPRTSGATDNIWKLRSVCCCRKRCAHHINIIKIIFAVKDEPERIRLVKQLISQLPAANKRLLADLLLFLQNLTQYANVTKMGSQNLAIVFGPNLIRPREDSIETLLHNMNHVNTVVCTMIEHVHAVCTIKSRPLVASEHGMTACIPSSYSSHCR